MDSRLITQELLQDGRTPDGRPTSLDLEQMASRVARSRLNVLIRGETGTGKTRLAKRIHADSDRANRPLVILTCAGLGSAAIERALFGQAPASTGRRGGQAPAHATSECVLAAADGGTLILDDVAALRPGVQAKLLQFIETGEIERGGAPGSRMDVRIVATTDQDLQAAVEAGTFRSDLLSRLDGVGFVLPPLRDRLDELPALAARFLGELCDRRPLPRPVFTASALATLQRHRWPGNLRELRHVIERAACVCAGGEIQPRDLMLPTASADSARSTPPSSSAPTAPRTAAASSNQAAEPPRRAALTAGAILGGTYRIGRLIGSGSTGQVYEATHTRLDGHFAVKVMHPHRAGDPRRVARFAREAQIASGLRHANIAAIFDFDKTDDGAPYLVMEYVEGRELAEVIADEAPLALDRVLTIVDQIASALAVVHQRDIVHRDLKPQNILLIPAHRPNPEQIKLVDFGISKIHLPSPALTTESAVLGTPQYMAPEQALGADDVGVRADQFALAAVVYEMLTGQKAFPGERTATVVYRIIHEDPAPLGALGTPALEAVLRRALSKDAAARFPSILDFASQLRAAASPTGPRPVSGTQDFRAPLDVASSARPAAGRWRRRSPSQSRAVAIGGRDRAGGRSARPGIRR